MMARTVAIGVQSFETLRMRNCFYVDKTQMIKEWWENEDDVTLLTRPRRFGKTLNMSMLECFFSTEYAGRGEELFGGLSIWQDEKYRKLQGTYPVINISFAGVKTITYQETKEMIYDILITAYQKSEKILKKMQLTDLEWQQIHSVNYQMNEPTAALALQKLSGYLSEYYGKKVLILLDEYDTPMQEAYVGGYGDELTAFLRNLFNATFKSNPYLERAIMTGITRVSKESIFSDLNHLRVVTTTSEEYADCFGFTEEEVFESLEEMGLAEKKEEVKQWYDGFTFGNLTDIYNPWSIINFLRNKGRLDSYWANTSSNHLIDKLVREGDAEVKEYMEELLLGKSICVSLDEQIVFSQLNENPSAIWSLLLAGGYLKVTEYEQGQNFTENKYHLKLTNEEVKRMFQSMIRNWFSKTSRTYSDFIKAMLMGNLDDMNDTMNEITRSLFSFFDTADGSGEEAEKFYHGFVLGLLVDLRGRYVVTSNRESGYGRYDVMLEPLMEKDPAMIMEFKKLRGRTEKTLEETVNAALKQIEEKQYEAVLLEKGIPKERIHKYGFAFEGKKVLIDGV